MIDDHFCEHCARHMLEMEHKYPLKQIWDGTHRVKKVRPEVSYRLIDSYLPVEDQIPQPEEVVKRVIATLKLPDKF